MDSDTFSSILDLCESRGIDQPSDLKVGQNRWGDRDRFWCFINEGDDGSIYGAVGSFSDINNKERGYGFCFGKTGLSIERTETQNNIIEKQLQSDEHKNIGYERAKARAKSIVETATGKPSTNSYIEKKGIDPFTALMQPISGDLVIPIYYRRQLVNVQTVYADDHSKKRPIKDGRKSGCYMVISCDINSDSVYICEGFATGASIAMAVGGGNVIATLDAGNMPKVADEIAYGHIIDQFKHVIICADNDENGKGQSSAKEAKRILMEHEISTMTCTPKVTGSDFNDIHLAKGLDEVRRAFGGFDEKTHSVLMSQPAPKFLVHGVIPLDEIGVVYGGSTIGKSFFALDLGMRIMDKSIDDWNGLKIDKHTNFVYFTNEDTASDNIRYRAWLQANNGTMDRDSDIRIVNEAIELSNDEDIDRVKMYLMSRRDVGLVIFDTAAVYLGVEDENDNSEVKRVIVKIRNEICKPLGITVILVCHTGKGDEGKTIRGASAYKDNVQFSIQIKSGDGSNAPRECVLNKVKNAKNDGKFLYKIKGFSTGIETKSGEPFSGGAVVWLDDSEQKTSEDSVLGKTMSVLRQFVSDNLSPGYTGGPVTLEKDRMINTAITLEYFKESRSASKKLGGPKCPWAKTVIDEGYITFTDDKRYITISEKYLSEAGFLK